MDNKEILKIAKKLVGLAKETELKEIRKDLKKMGFKVKTKQMSWGTQASFLNSSGREMPTMFTVKSREEWIPLIDYLANIEKKGIQVVDNYGDFVYGFGKRKK